MMILVFGNCAFIARVALSPFMRCMRMSIKTMSGFVSRQRRSAWSPSEHSVISRVKGATNERMKLRNGGLSSTINSFIFTSGCQLWKCQRQSSATLFCGVVPHVVPVMNGSGVAPIRILIADDHPVVRVGLRAAIQQDSQLEVIAEVSTGEAAVENVEQLDPEVAIIDLNMPQMNGIAALHQIRKSNSRIKIVILTAHDAEDLFQAAMEAGANGYLLKESGFTEIVAAIRAVWEGGCYVPRSMMGRLLTHQQRVSPTPPRDQATQDLSPVERRILLLIAEKRSSKEIAEEFGVAVRTVENRRATICEKLGLSGVNSLLKYALEHKSDLC